MTDQNDPIEQIQKEEESCKTRLAGLIRENEKDYTEKRSEYEIQLSELENNLKNEGMEELQKAKKVAAENYKKSEEESKRARENKIKEAETKKDQAVSILENAFKDFIKN